MGRLGKDPEVKTSKNGTAITNLSIATSKEWKDEAGAKQEKTEWHNVVCFKKTAEIAGKYLTKGRQVYIEGELQTRSWDDTKSGEKRYKTEIVANNIQFIGDNNGKTETSDGPAQSSSPAPTTDEIPF